jgi:hypothetical protein
MRLSIFTALLLLSACGEPDPDAEQQAAKAEQTAVARASDDGIDCALAGAEGFERACLVERGEGGSLTIRHPDGGFRRLLITDDRRGVVAADGAAEARVEIIAGKVIEVSIEDDRYRLPATIKSGQPPAP